jgi:3',5'-cyclic AMP phosphodiesterase CpdA
MPSSADLTFVHLSDIHFRKGLVGTKHDPDLELRHELAADLRNIVPRFGPISGIIITGDIAFSGHRAEYLHAFSWIASIAEHLQCKLSDVMVIPGNHDIDRARIERNNREILKIQRSIRRGGDAARCGARLADFLSGHRRKLLIAPLGEFNRFAEQFSCNVSWNVPFWERPYKLGDGATIVVRGVTSTWLSGPDDSERTARLMYGSAQYEFSGSEATHRVVAAHHPPQNMIDGEEAGKAFDFYCRLQLFGHKHSHWVSSSKNCAKISAGALQPDRREKPWTPRYNILQVSGELAGKSHRLKLSIYPRRWSDEFRVFMADFRPDASEVREYEFPSQ